MREPRTEAGRGLPQPEVARAAQAREDAEIWYRLSIARAKKEGRQEGREEGREEGRLAGARQTLARLIQLKFGVFSEEVVSRLETATAGDLDHWSERILGATSLDEVFGDFG